MSGHARSFRGSRQGSASTGQGQPGSGPNSPLNPQSSRSTSNPQASPASGPSQYGSLNSPRNIQMPRSTANPQMATGRGQSQFGSGPNSPRNPQNPQASRSTSNPEASGGNGPNPSFSTQALRSTSNPQPTPWRGQNQPPQGPGSPVRPGYSPITPTFSPLSPQQPSRGQRSMGNPRALSFSNAGPSGQASGSGQAPGGGEQHVLAFRPNDPPWPVNRGYVCHTTWTPSRAQMAGDSNATEVRAGDQGCILQRTEDKKMVYITISRTGTRGWIPMDKNHINIGQAIYGRITHKGSFPIAPLALAIAPRVDVSSDLYPRTVYSILSAIGQEGDKIHIKEELMVLVRSPHYCATLTNRIEEGARKAGGLAVLNQQDFTLHQLESSLTQVRHQNNANVPGIYTQVIGSASQSPEIRIGKAFDLAEREVSHRGDITREYTRFHKAAGKSRSYKMYTLIRDLDDDTARTLAENTTILQFASYAGHNFQPTKPTDRSWEALEKAHAQFLTGLADAAFRTTGWTPATKRPNFGCTKGWNSSSPLFEQGIDSAIFSRTDSATMATFRRTASRVGTEGRVMRIMPAAGYSTRYLQFVNSLTRVRLGTDNYPEVNDEVYVVVEIMLNGERHPKGYARLPKIASWSDHNLAAGVAIKTQWYNQKADTWMEKYHQISNPKTTLNEEASPRIYSQCMALRRFFMRETLPDFQESWQLDIGRLARVKKITFDNLEQTMIATDLTGSVKGQAPSRVPKNTIMQQLRQAGATPQNIDHAWPESGKRPFNNTRCDFCIINGDSGRGLAACPREGNNHRCELCYRYGIVCSWTTTYNEPLRQLLMFQPALEDKFEPIQDPGFTYGTV